MRHMASDLRRIDREEGTEWLFRFYQRMGVKHRIASTCNIFK
jgi:hypothetical protein